MQSFFEAVRRYTTATSAASDVFVPFHVRWVGLDIIGGPIDNGWAVANWTVHVL